MTLGTPTRANSVSRNSVTANVVGDANFWPLCEGVYEDEQIVDWASEINLNTLEWPRL